MTRCIAFHSYKGGTGKTTIASNLAAIYAAKGHTVALLDLDVYAPSLPSYFDRSPDKWINDVLADSAKTKDVMVDMTPYIKSEVPGAKVPGKVWVGFSNPQKEAVYKLEGSGRQPQPKIQVLRKFIEMRDELISDYECDYILLDTSPGIRYWSINSLAIADVLLLTLKFGDLDIGGTRQMANDIYGAFTEFGAKSYLLLNRVGGYCVPNSLVLASPQSSMEGTVTVPQISEGDLGLTLSKEVSMDLISAIPCYCDIQFSRKEFLTVLQYPNHPFAKQIEKLSMSDQLKL